MQVKDAAIEAIIPYEFNNRNHDAVQIDRIANSIKEFGFNQPIVVDESNIVLVGHGRLLAAQKLGLLKVPVVKLDKLTENQKKAYRILDNKLQNDSTWSFDNLELELGFLEDNDFDLKSWGLDELRGLFDKDEPETYEDGPIECENEETFIKLGDIINLGEHCLICADCTSWDLESLGLFDMIITDPPYGVAYIGKTDDALTIENDDIDEESLTNLWNGCIDALWANLKDGGVIYAAVPPGPLRQIFAQALKDRGALRQELVWLKNSLVMGRSDYHYKHEPILYGWKPGAAHYVTTDRSKTDVLEHDRPTASREHPTMKPISLWAELIGNSSRQGETIFDPFLGSGTTLIACDQLKRICYGVEIEPKYCHVIVERYKRHCEKVGKPFECKINGEPYSGAPD
jgi:site-specific DNA-methyltransferase (adenine-specific)